MTQSVVTAGMDFMANGIIRPNGLASTVSRETNHMKKTTFSNNNIDLQKNQKNLDDIDLATTLSSSSSSTIKQTSDKSIEEASSSSSVIEIIDESRSPEQPQKITENVEDDPCIQSIMDLSLPSPLSNGNMDECMACLLIICCSLFSFTVHIFRFLVQQSANESNDNFTSITNRSEMVRRQCKRFFVE